MWQASVHGLKDMVGAYENSKTWISSSPTHHFFFSRFMTGVHKRVGELVKRDEPVTVEMLKEIDKLLTQRWDLEMAKPKHERDLGKLKEIAMMGLWFLGGFCTGLRGEEMILIEMAGTQHSLKFLSEPGEGQLPHFEFVIAGRVKGKHQSGVKFAVPCVGVTQGSGLRPGKWAILYCGVERNLAKKNGRRMHKRLFNSKAKDPKLYEFENLFFSLLEDVQALRPDLIDPEMNVREEFGTFRSLRRGVTAHAINMMIPENVIKAINRWRKERNSTAPKLDIIEIYAQLKQLKPTMLRYSSGL